MCETFLVVTSVQYSSSVGRLVGVGPIQSADRDIAVY